MKDSHGRVIDYLRISLTDRCNFRCIYCMPEEGVNQLAHDEILRIEEIEQAVRVAADMGIRSIRLTGGEPLVRKGVVELVRSIADVPGIENVSMTTNGVLLPQMASALKAAGLSRVNISLDTLDENQFRQITRCGSLDQTLAGIEAALEAGFNPVKINAVAVRSLNQDYLAFAKLSIDRPLHVRFIEYMPVGESSGVDGCGWGERDVVPSEELLGIINERARAAGMDELVAAGEDSPLGWGPARYFEFPGAQGTVGFISPLSRHFCSECNRLRLTADGKLRPCLFSDDEYDLRAALRADTEGMAAMGEAAPLDEAPLDEAARAVFAEALGAKPDEHHDKVGTERGMSQIGG
ncbi:MAG: GTP 3',8-cyclase MoaA [Gordonibacter sp.]|nr:GTP 3',8-cyclase MoaA [Gordonibacter sp.]